MAQVTAKPPPAEPPVPETPSLMSRALSYVFDVRFLGVIGQIAFIAIVVFGFLTLTENFRGNVDKLGASPVYLSRW